MTLVSLSKYVMMGTVLHASLGPGYRRSRRQPREKKKRYRSTGDQDEPPVPPGRAKLFPSVSLLHAIWQEDPVSGTNLKVSKANADGA